MKNSLVRKQTVTYWHDRLLMHQTCMVMSYQQIFDLHPSRIYVFLIAFYFCKIQGHVLNWRIWVWLSLNWSGDKKIWLRNQHNHVEDVQQIYVDLITTALLLRTDRQEDRWARAFSFHYTYFPPWRTSYGCVSLSIMQHTHTSQPFFF